jgi:Per1-like family
VQAVNPYAGVWWTYIFACCFAWVSSAVFHSRDTKLTERTDYIAAIAVVFAGAALAAVRVTGTTKCVSVINVHNRAQNHKDVYMTHIRPSDE